MAHSASTTRYPRWAPPSQSDQGNPARAVFLCRTELEGALAEEISHTLNPGKPPSITGQGLVIARDLPPSPWPDLIFEQQRIPHAGWIPHEQLKPISDDTFSTLFPPHRPSNPWTLHVLCPSGIQDQQWSRSAKGIGSALLRLAKSMVPEAGPGSYHQPEGDLPPGTRILQVLRVPEGAWFGWGDPSVGVRPYPGGIIRLKFDSRAPSRSYLKLEEAFQRMGREPTTGQWVVDLGAAPGGWTHACLKRGARVQAVDHGPMKIVSELRQNLRIVKSNGITYTPEAHQLPVDWLVADMLIPPGTALGLIKHWLGNHRCRHAVINIKLPQQNPYQAVRPIASWLQRQARGYQWSMKNLHHDRREITLMAIETSG
ncbi:MAG: hypothetical protein KDL31_04630 [Kiritimatiellae bacterium]|nr:hypothetical protein [Kiritimatiellia bacterium]